MMMTTRRIHLVLIHGGLSPAVLIYSGLIVGAVSACSGDIDGPAGAPPQETAQAGAGGVAASGNEPEASGAGGMPASGGAPQTPGTGGMAAVAGSAGQVGQGGVGGRGDAGGVGGLGDGMEDAGVDRPADPGPEPPPDFDPLDCGAMGVAIEDQGPPDNRVNYVILGDGYTERQFDTTFMEHIDVAMEKRFSEVIGQPYGRYRKFVNICALKIPSQTGPIGSGPTAFSCSGDDQSRLARCDRQAADRAIADNLPASFEVDWKAVMLNNDRWWNTGSVLMLWSGGHPEAAGAALHEGGHGFHQLADEYSGNNTGCDREYNEVNMTADSSQTAGKWDRWVGFDQVGATGMQGIIEGGRYCNRDQYRPSENSMMNSLFNDRPNTAFNPVSREKMVMDIWRAIRPIDSTSPPEGGDISDVSWLQVHVIDPEVISVDWSVDGEMVAEDGGTAFSLAEAELSAGTHTIEARAYDNAGTDLVRYRDGEEFGRMNWARSQQTVTWTVTVP